jgi:hypothetical protein
MDKEKQVLELFNKYYEYVRTTDDGEQRGEWKRDFARQVVKLFCQPAVIESLPEHECKYCGVMTTQPDEECYKAPDNTGNVL